METWTIEDFKSATYPVLRNHIEKFEVAEYKKHTMKGRVTLPENEIKFKDLKGSHAFTVFEKLRAYSTPKLTDSLIGKVLIWDNYIIKLK